MFKKIRLYFDTVKYLKCSQVFWQVFYRVKPHSSIIERNDNLVVEFISFQFVPTQRVKFMGNNTFCFLNLKYQFDSIDWNFLNFGKLWNYNLEYFDYLFQNDVSDEDKFRLLYSFYEYCKTNNKPLEPYPVSLRVINAAKYVSLIKNKDNKILNYVHQELFFLDRNIEFQILGNHLLENAFALCLGGAFFKNASWHDKAIKILKKELNEQTLEDGAHFELSPMYHNIILFRVLELIDWYSKYNSQKQEFLSFCREIASRMCAWAKNIQFSNGDFPLFNDAAKGISFDTWSLIEYANKLGIEPKNINLGQSGYRSFANQNYEIKIDLAQIGASYQPGHVHADALSFVLYSHGKPLFVEQGTSTYQIGERRNLERSTEAHNTVTVNNRNQSDVWGGFRVGNRAKTTIHHDETTKYIASHNGYKTWGTIHTRTFIFEEFCVQIYDSLNNKDDAKGYIHLHPDRNLVKVADNEYIIDDFITLVFESATVITVEDYEYAESYNEYQPAKRLVISFEKEMSTKIFFKKS